MKPTLLILAAGMGSRYGGLKQLDAVGPSGETIMDYSVYDAIRAGFGKIVFVIRHDFEKDFREKVLSKYEGKIKVEVAFQDIKNLPEPFTPNPDRSKPWGTNHAVMSGADKINEPFAVINADDFYGRDSFRVLGNMLQDMDGKSNSYCMVGFNIEKTLSENGTVSRGACIVDEKGNLSDVTECHAIEKIGNEIYYAVDDIKKTLPSDTIVSMNMWGFTPDYFNHSLQLFIKFLKENEKDLKAEFYIPSVVNHLIKSGKASVKVLSTTSQWFGVTYAADKESTVCRIKQMVDAGEYPEKLF